MNARIINKINNKFEVEKAEQLKLNEKDKMMIINEVKTAFKIDPYNFHAQETNDSKYKLKMLSPDDYDYKKLNRACQSPDGAKEIGCIYKITENNQSNNQDGDKMLLLHGTKSCNVRKIIRSGIKASERGACGRGVYMTDDFASACSYGESEALKNFRLETFSFVFVFQVMRAEKLKKFKPKRYGEELLDLNCFCKVLRVEEKEGGDDAFDSEGRRLVRGTFDNCDLFSNANEFVADEEIVSPCYLIVCEDEADPKNVKQESFENEKIECFLSKEIKRIERSHERYAQNIIKRIEAEKQKEMEKAFPNISV